MTRLFWIALALLAGGLALLVANHSAGETLGLANGEFARVVGLSALALVLGAGLLHRRSPLSDTLRQVALWLLITLALVAGYQYRYELQDVAHRVSAGLVPGSPVALFDAEGRASVMLQRSLGGHFETRVTIDGTTIPMLVDTGASATVLSAADARRVGIDVDRLSFTVPVSTANGMAFAARAVARELAVGDIARRNLPLLVAAPGALEGSLLGMNFIGTLSGFDMRGDRLILRD